MRIYVNPFQQLRNEMDRMLTGFLGPTIDGLWHGSLRGQPAVNLWDQGELLMAEMECPGVNSDQIDVTAAGDQLTINVNRPDQSAEDVVYHRRERPAGSFTRVLTLPCAINADGVKADLQNGVLRLSLPKAESAKPRKINVASA